MKIESRFDDREVTITTTEDITPGRIAVRNRNSGDYELAFLTPRGAYELIEALKDFAEKPKTAQEQFREMPLGAHFMISTLPGVEYVKIADSLYVVIGGLGVILAASNFRPDTVLEVKK